MKKTIITSILLGITIFSAFSQQTLTLEQCKALALKNNLKVKNAELSVEAAKQQKKEAFTNYFPSISATGVGFLASKPMMSMEMDMSAQMKPLTDVLGPLIGWGMMNGAPIDPAALAAMQNQEPTKIEALQNGIIGGVMATQPISAGGQIVNGNRLAKAGVEAKQLQKQMTDNEVILSTEYYFWQLISLQEKMKTIENAEKMLDRIFSDVEIAVEAGLTTRNDLLRVELERNKLESSRFKAENGLNVLKLAFALHLGLSANDFQIQAPEFDDIHLHVTNNDTALLQNRLEYKLLAKSADIAKIQVNMEIGKHLPTIAIGAGYQYMNFDMKKTTSIKNNFGMLFASVSVPLTDWWGGSHAIKRKKLEHRVAENTLKENGDLLLLQMQQTRNELNEAYHQVQLSQKSISVAEENLQISNDNYNAGITTLSDLLEAQNLLQQSHDQHTEAFTNYQIALVKYRQMVGK